jgi:phage terminase large subunit-like protein
VDGVSRANQYVDGVLGGSICAPKLVRLACERYKRDLRDKRFRFDADSANGAISNIEKLPHVKGKWQGRPLKLEPFQCFIVANLFGFKWAETGLRRFREAYLQQPRKNGKTTLIIGIALVLFGPDMEPGAEVYLGATGQDQARRLLYQPARYMVDRCPKFKDRFGIETAQSAMTIPENFSRLMAVIGKPDDGDSPHAGIVDEWHEHETSDQYDTFATGMGAREQPMLIVITTAGSNLGGPCKEHRDDCVKILEGHAESDSRFILIYEPDEDDAWDDPATLRKVNPNIGVSVSEAYLLDQLEQAKRSATKQNTFKTKHLNCWVGARTAWMNMLAWQRQKREMRLEDFAGSDAWLAIDLASKKDVAAINVLIPDGRDFVTFSRFYAPEAAAEENEKYREYATGGWLTLTPGSATDYGEIENEIDRLARILNVREAGFDPWQAQMLMQRLSVRGMPVVEFPHQVRTFSDPMKEIEALALDRRLWHDGNPCMTWMVSNCTAKVDAKDNIYPRKERDAEKIDGLVALIMSMGLAMRARDEGDFDDWLANPVGFRRG